MAYGIRFSGTEGEVIPTNQPMTASYGAYPYVDFGFFEDAGTGGNVGNEYLSGVTFTHEILAGDSIPTTFMREIRARTMSASWDSNKAIFNAGISFKESDTVVASSGFEFMEYVSDTSFNVKDLWDATDHEMEFDFPTGLKQPAVFFGHPLDYGVEGVTLNGTTLVTFRAFITLEFLPGSTASKYIIKAVDTLDALAEAESYISSQLSSAGDYNIILCDLTNSPRDHIGSFDRDSDLHAVTTSGSSTLTYVDASGFRAEASGPVDQGLPFSEDGVSTNIVAQAGNIIIEGTLDSSGGAGGFEGQDPGGDGKDIAITAAQGSINFRRQNLNGSFFTEPPLTNEVTDISVTGTQSGESPKSTYSIVAPAGHNPSSVTGTFGNTISSIAALTIIRNHFLGASPDIGQYTVGDISGDTFRITSTISGSEVDLGLVINRGGGGDLTGLATVVSQGGIAATTAEITDIGLTGTTSGDDTGHITPVSEETDITFSGTSESLVDLDQVVDLSFPTSITLSNDFDNIRVNIQQGFRIFYFLLLRRDGLAAGLSANYPIGGFPITVAFNYPNTTTTLTRSQIADQFLFLMTRTAEQLGNSTLTVFNGSVGKRSGDSLRVTPVNVLPNVSIFSVPTSSTFTTNITTVSNQQSASSTLSTYSLTLDSTHASSPITGTFTGASSATSMASQIRTSVTNAMNVGTVTGLTVKAGTNNVVELDSTNVGSRVNIILTITNGDGSSDASSSVTTQAEGVDGNIRLATSFSVTTPRGTLAGTFANSVTPAVALEQIRGLIDNSGYSVTTIANNKFTATSDIEQAETDITFTITEAGTGGDLVPSVDVTTQGISFANNADYRAAVLVNGARDVGGTAGLPGNITISAPNGRVGNFTYGTNNVAIGSPSGTITVRDKFGTIVLTAATNETGIFTGTIE